MVVTMNNGITLLDQLPVPTIKDIGILYRIEDNPYKVKINGLKTEPNPNLKKTTLITVSFTFIDNGEIELDNINGKWYCIEDGDICNHTFVGDDMHDDLYIDNENDFYDILNLILQNKGLIPKGNDKAIKISKDKLKEYLKGETIILKTIDADIGYFHTISKIIPTESLMVGGL